MPKSRICSIAGCGKPHVARNMCRKHYSDWHFAHRKSTAMVCKISGCEAKVWLRDLCCSHYERWRKYGDPSVPLKLDRGGRIKFVQEVAIQSDTNACVIWPFRLAKQKSRRSPSYPRLQIGGTEYLAHRYVCQVVNGEPADQSMDCCHNCGNPKCVNPRHLRWGTRTENMADKLVHGTHNRGERNGRAKISDDDVRTIRASDLDRSELSKKYGLAKTTVVNILRRKTWKHVV